MPKGGHTACLRNASFCGGLRGSWGHPLTLRFSAQAQTKSFFIDLKENARGEQQGGTGQGPARCMRPLLLDNNPCPSQPTHHLGPQLHQADRVSLGSSGQPPSVFCSACAHCTLHAMQACALAIRIRRAGQFHGLPASIKACSLPVRTQPLKPMLCCSTGQRAVSEQARLKHAPACVSAGEGKARRQAHLGLATCGLWVDNYICPWAVSGRMGRQPTSQLPQLQVG